MIEQRRLLISKRLQKSLKRKSTRQRVIRYGLIAGNALVLLAVIVFVALSSHSNHPVAAAMNSNAATVNPVDGLTSYDIAANVAKLTDLPEQTAIDNQAQSAKVSLAVSASDTSIVAKPQIVATALKSRADIQSYVVKSGDTLASIAQKFGVTSDSIRWSNGLGGSGVTPGKKLTIPPINGIVYTVKRGDTIQSIAKKYSANASQITAFNDAELSGIKTGEQILIPNGQVAPVAVATFGGGFSGGFGSFTATYGSNGYDYGYCTWYVASRISVPSNWGNANTWAYYAAMSGWTVSSVPRVGSIAQTAAGYAGHVAIVESVNSDGTVTISEMNATAGWGRVDTRKVPISSFEHYIYR